MSDSGSAYKMDAIPSNTAGYSEAIDLISTAERAVSDAVFLVKGATGDYFLHVEETLSSDYLLDESFERAEWTREVPWWESDDYVVKYAVGIHPQVPSAKLLKAVEGGVTGFGEMTELRYKVARMISDSVVSRYARRISSAKGLISTDGLSEVTLTVDLEQYNKGEELFPTTVVDLSLMRLYDDEAEPIVQRRKVESDPNTGRIAVANSLQNVPWENEGPNDFLGPRITALYEQSKHLPTPADKILTMQEWHKLITQPLSHQDIIG